MFRLVERDYLIMREIERWRVCLGRHVRHLAGFSGQRATDRRLRVLIDAGYIDRQKILYGVPYIYKLTYKGKVLIYANTRIEQIKIDQIIHDIAVLDTAIYFLLKENLNPEDITTEKELHQKDGFGVRKRRPDFLYKKDNKIYCVEIERTFKSKAKIEENLNNNFREYDGQKWIVPNSQPRIINTIKSNMRKYAFIEILSLEEVIKYVGDNK